MCHNGEFASQMYEVKKKTKEEFLMEYESCYKDRSAIKKLRPMTLEGAVVRISDLIAYLGRDIEDAKRMGLIDFSDIPLSIKENLGKSNREIVNTIVMDIINNSIGKDYIKLSDNVFKSIIELKKFNYENIYYKAYTEEEKDKLKLMLNTLFNKYMKDLENNNTDSNIIKSFLANMSDEYKNNNSNARIVIDYIAGMTDDYTLREYNNYLNLAHTKFE